MRGFTLIEIITVSAIIIILFVVSVPFYAYFQTFSVLGSARQEVTANIRLTQAKAVAGENDSSFGVYLIGNQYILFQGDTYTTRATGQDIIFTLQDHISFSGTTEIRFAEKTGLPAAATIVTLVNSVNGANETISINSFGAIN